MKIKQFCTKCFTELDEDGIEYVQDFDHLHHFGTPCINEVYTLESKCCEAYVEAMDVAHDVHVCTCCKEECQIVWPNYGDKVYSLCCHSDVIPMTREDASTKEQYVAN